MCSDQGLGKEDTCPEASSRSCRALLLWTAPVACPHPLVSTPSSLELWILPSRRVFFFSFYFLGSFQSSYVNKERPSPQKLSLIMGLVTLVKSLPPLSFGCGLP